MTAIRSGAKIAAETESKDISKVKQNKYIKISSLKKRERKEQ